MTGRCLWLGLCLFVAPASMLGAPCPTDAFADLSSSPGAGPGYPAPYVEARCTDESLVISSNAIPHYEFVPMTPNPLVALPRDYRFPLRPVLAEQPGPLPLLGPSGVAINGIPLFGPNEGPVPPPGYGDPVFNQIMDSCMGHTARQYHYHALVQSCLVAGQKSGDPSPILAFAADGFPVYGPFGCADEACSKVIEYRSSWEEVREPRIDAWDSYQFRPKDGVEYLDRCNGHAGDDHGGAYHYHATPTFPYIMGCFSGTPSTDAGRAEDRQMTRDGPGGPRGVPPEDPRPSAETVQAAAEKLGIDAAKLAEALRLTEGRVVPMNYAASARTLGIDHAELNEALGVPAPMRSRPRRGRGPGGERDGPRGRPGGPRRGPPPQR